MKAIFPTKLLLLWGLMLPFFSCTGQETSQAPAVQNSENDTSRYQLGTQSRDGIGKYYMGREISHVMGHLGASWLERPEREQEEKSSLLMANLPLEKDFTIADIGAGTGYFTIRMAELVPEGKVLAVDIQPEMLAIIDRKKAELEVNKVQSIEGTVTNPNLPGNSVDMLLMVDVYHEFSHPYEMMTAIYNALKPGGKVVLVEYRMEDETVPIKRLHKMSLDQAKKEMEAVGLHFVENKPMLPWQHLMVFEKPQD